MNSDLLFWGLIFVGWGIVSQLKANRQQMRGDEGYAVFYDFVSSICMLLALAQIWWRG